MRTTKEPQNGGSHTGRHDQMRARMPAEQQAQCDAHHGQMGHAQGGMMGGGSGGMMMG